MTLNDATEITRVLFELETCNTEGNVAQTLDGILKGKDARE